MITKTLLSKHRQNGIKNIIKRPKSKTNFKTKQFPYKTKNVDYRGNVILLFRYKIDNEDNLKHKLQDILDINK